MVQALHYSRQLFKLCDSNLCSGKIVQLPNQDHLHYLYTGKYSEGFINVTTILSRYVHAHELFLANFFKAIDEL